MPLLSRDAYVLVPEYVILHGKVTLRLQMKLKLLIKADLKIGILSWICRWVQSNYRNP